MFLLSVSFIVLLLLQKIGIQISWVVGEIRLYLA